MLVLHAGPHKTATTYLQENLRRSRRALTARGWHYPRLGTGGLAGHHDLTRNLDDWLTPGTPGHQDLAKLAHRPQLVFSSEFAARWTPERYTALADALGRDRVDVVYALRDPVDLFQSFWSEQIKQGMSASLAERMAEHFADPYASVILNPLPVLGPLCDDPRIRLHVMPFEILRAEKIDLFTHFCASVLGLEGMAAKVPVQRNVAMPIHQTEFLRLVTLVVSQGAKKIDSTLRHHFIAGFSRDEHNAFGALIRDHGQAARRIVRFPERTTFKTELEAQLRARLKGRWTHEPGETSLYSTKPQRYLYYETYTLMQVPEIAEAVEEALHRLGEQNPKMRQFRFKMRKLKERVSDSWAKQAR